VIGDTFGGLKGPETGIFLCFVVFFAKNRINKKTKDFLGISSTQPITFHLSPLINKNKNRIVGGYPIPF
jgi:hypothetical protein